MQTEYYLSIIFSKLRHDSHGIFHPRRSWNSLWNIVCIIFLLTVLGCSPKNTTYLPPVWLKDVYNDSSWCRHYQKLLQNSYIELSPLENCIVSASLKHFQEPDLHTTLGAVLVLKALDRKVPNIPGIARWLYHLRDDSSGFFNTGNLFHMQSFNNTLQEKIDATENAINLLKALGHNLHEPTPLIQTLADLQQKDGWFILEAADSSLQKIDDSDIQNTFQILRILLAISDSSALKLAKNSSNSLKTWLNEHQKSVITALQTTKKFGEIENSREVIYFLAISEVLAQITPEYIDDNEKQVLKEIFEYIRRKYVDSKEPPLSYSAICFLHTVKNVTEAFHCPAVQTQPLSNYITKKLIPALQQDNPFIEDVFDFNILVVPVELIRWAGKPFPGTPRLLETIEKYYIDNGWMRILVYMPEYSSMPAYKLWWCTRILGMDTFDPIRLGNFFWYSLKQNYSGYVFRDWYYMLRGIHLSGQFTDDPFIKSLQDSSIQYLLNIKDNQERCGALIRWIRVAQSENWPFPESLKPSFIKEVNQGLVAHFIERNHRVNIDDLHGLAFVQSYLDTCLVSPADIADNLQALWSEKTGAFSPLLQEEYPSLLATRQALEIIFFLKKTELLDEKKAERIRQFVLSCKMKYGFSNVAPSYRNPDEFESWAMAEYTYDAFLILKMLEEIPEMLRSDINSVNNTFRQQWLRNL